MFLALHFTALCLHQKGVLIKNREGINKEVMEKVEPPPPELIKHNN